ncbi:MAG: hypothetical protein KAH54_11415 [Candidatus Sabulitectum sp.]|nr:hypothetical protein [Candidatus Sabulitectum sp.]
MRLFIAMVIAAGLILTGCGDSSSGPSADPDYLPVSVGNHWDYGIDGFMVSSSDDTLSVEGSFLREVTRTVTHENGSALFELEDISSLSVEIGDTVVVWTDTSYTYAFDADSEFIGYDDSLSADYEIILKLPPTLGETWEPETDDPTVVREVVSLSASISVPSGNYTGCIHLRDTDSDDPDYLWNMYLVPDIGPAMFLMEEADSSSFTHMEVDLESYVIN